MTATSCVPDAYTSSSTCLIPPSSDVSVSATTTVPREAPSGSLPVTGGDVAGFALLGAIAVAAGLAARRARHG